MRRFKIFPAFLLLILRMAVPANAQYASHMAAADTIHAIPATAFNPSSLIAPGILVAGALGIHYLAHDTLDISIRDAVIGMNGGNVDTKLDDYIQYVPVAGHLVLGGFGAPSRLNFTDRFIENALGHLVLAVLSGGGKELFHTLRPNEVDYKSFPSGHTAQVFIGAELMRLDYGPYWGAGAYAIGCMVAVMRIYRNWHWFSDVIMGAGLGILAARCGQLLLVPFKNLVGIHTSRADIALVPAYNPATGSIGLELACAF